MEPRSGGGWLRVGGRVVGSCILESPSGGLGGAPATLAGAQRVGPRPFLKLFPPLLEVSQDLPPPAFPLRALAGGVGGVGGGRGESGGRPCAHARKDPWGEGLREEPGGGCGFRFSGLSSSSLLSAGFLPPLPSGKGKGRKP